MKGYKCYETTIFFDSKEVVGYGRDENESFCNSIKNFFDLMLLNDS